MRLTALLPPLLSDDAVAGLIKEASSSVRTDRSVVVSRGARPAVLAAMTCAVIGAIISAIGLVRLVRRPR